MTKSKSGKRKHYSVNSHVYILKLLTNVACRVKMNPKNAINERFLPRFLDFVVWGHEHECLIDPQVLEL